MLVRVHQRPRSSSLDESSRLDDDIQGLDGADESLALPQDALGAVHQLALSARDSLTHMALARSVWLVALILQARGVPGLAQNSKSPTSWWGFPFAAADQPGAFPPPGQPAPGEAIWM
jgi:hypothetical protein